MMRFYYDGATKKVVNHCYFDEDAESAAKGLPSFDLGEAEWEKTLSVIPYAKAYFYRDGSLSLEDDPDVVRNEEYEAKLRADEIAELKRYLSDTDYVISKLNELKLEGEEGYEAERADYSDVLKKRKEARARINELEG